MLVVGFEFSYFLQSFLSFFFALAKVIVMTMIAQLCHKNIIESMNKIRNAEKQIFMVDL